MKKSLSWILALVLLFSFTGCGAKQKLEEKVNEKVFEAVGGGKIDIDGDKFTIKGDNGETATFGDKEWPTSELAKLIPEFKNGTVNGVLESADSVVITLDSVKEEDVAPYWETIKKDFPSEEYEMVSSGFISYNGRNEAGTLVGLTYLDNTLSITLTVEGE